MDTNTNSMSAQHTPGPRSAMRSHLRKPGGTRAVCRYASRPSSKVKPLGLIAFQGVLVAMRCAECNRYFVGLNDRAAIAKATGGAA